MYPVTGGGPGLSVGLTRVASLRSGGCGRCQGDLLAGEAFELADEVAFPTSGVDVMTERGLPLLVVPGNARAAQVHSRREAPGE